MSRLWSKFLDLLFPHTCLGCGLDGTFLCATCARHLPQPFPYHEPVVKKLIRLLKYRRVGVVAADLAPYLYARVLEELAEQQQLTPASKFLLIPIPLHPEREKIRGFNQAAEIAKALSRFNPELFQLKLDVLTKIKDTPSQVSVKKRSERLKNIVGAFAVTRPELVEGKNILLVDDVVTTGGTMGEATRVLKDAGAKKIIPLSIAES